VPCDFDFDLELELRESLEMERKELGCEKKTS
jgi:hypothetical protein